MGIKNLLGNSKRLLDNNGYVQAFVIVSGLGLAGVTGIGLATATGIPLSDLFAFSGSNNVAPIEPDFENVSPDGVCLGAVDSGCGREVEFTRPPYNPSVLIPT